MSGAWALAPDALQSGAGALEVWTEKEGLLSRVAHDLCLAAETASVTIAPSGAEWALEVRVPIRGLRVRGQVQGGAVTPLSGKDHAEIEGNLRGPKVLDAGRFPEAVYRGTCRLAGERAEVRGELELRGARRPLALAGTWREQAPGRVEVAGEVRFAQTTFGITPYSALLGALKLKDALRVSWRLPLTRPEGD